MYAKNEKIYSAYVLKHNSNCEKEAILLMIPNGERLIVVKELSSLLKEIASKYFADFYCLNYLHSFRTKSKLLLHKKVCENKTFCDVAIPSEDIKILINTKILVKRRSLFM